MSGKSGIFITLEGGEGAGKTTQARKIKDYLALKNIECVLTREPGGTPEAEKIRDLIVQRQTASLTPESECLLLYAARHLHVEQVIKPALSRGTVVVSDRFNDSTMAYQGYGHGLDLNWINNLDHLVLQDFAPDLTFIFDLPVNIGLQRSREQKNKAAGRESTEDRFENLKLEFHERLRQGFLEIAKRDPDRYKILDATQSPDQIFDQIKSVIDRKI